MILNNKGNFVIPGIYLSHNWASSYFVLFEVNRQGTLLQSITDTTWTNILAPQTVQLPLSKEYYFIDMFYVSVYDSSLSLKSTFFHKFYNWFVYLYRKGSNNNNAYFVGDMESQVFVKNADILEKAQESYSEITYYLVGSNKAKTTYI